MIASSFGEISYSNAMNNRLLAVMLPEPEVQALMREAAEGAAPLRVAIDVERLTVRTPRRTAPFPLSERHRRMFLDGLDLIGARSRSARRSRPSRSATGPTPGCATWRAARATG